VRNVEFTIRTKSVVKGEKKSFSFYVCISRHHRFLSLSLSLSAAASCSILQTGHITLSFTPDQQLENHSTKYHRHQPLYNTLELLMMGIVVPETC
jgi:hypothetical protein